MLGAIERRAGERSQAITKALRGDHLGEFRNGDELLRVEGR